MAGESSGVVAEYGAVSAWSGGVAGIAGEAEGPRTVGCTSAGCSSSWSVLLAVHLLGGLLSAHLLGGLPAAHLLCRLLAHLPGQEPGLMQQE